jgi:hypothetical protein
MIWLTWRHFRSQAWTALGGLALVAAVLAATGPHLADLFRSSGLDSCTGVGAGPGACGRAQTVFFDGVKADAAYPLLYFAGIALLYLVPAVIGMFWGAPLVTRELEAGTLRLAWSQSVTRTRWLAVRLGLVGAAALLTEGLLSLAVTWWSAPIDRADGLPGQSAGGSLPDRFMPLVFGARDIAPIGYAAFAFVLGVAVGVLVRRTLPAMAIVLAVFTAVQVVVPMALRAHYVAPEQTTTALTLSATGPSEIRIEGSRMSVSVPVVIPGAWVVSTRTVDAAGRPFTGPAPQSCVDITGSPEQCDDAINGLRLRQVAEYQPAGRFWEMQRDETGGYLLLALALAGACVLRIRRVRLS